MNEKEKISNVRDVIQADNELLDNISGLIEENASESILNILADMHSADIAEIINRMRVDDGSYIFNLLDNETAGEVVTEIDEELREKILKNVDTKKLTDIVDELDTDDATDLLSELPDTVAEHVLTNIDKEYSEDVKELLKYPEDTSGGIMNSDFVSIGHEATIEDAINEIRKNSDEIDHIFQIYVLKPDDELIGVVLLKTLLIHPLHTKITDVMEEDLIYVTVDMDQEQVANMMEKYDLVAVPVVNEKKQMLGRITVDDIIDVIQEEASEDIQKMAGLSEEEGTSYSAFRVSRIRLPWLLVALTGQLVSAVVLSSFEASIQQIIIASFFIPIVMAMGGSSGMQAAIVVVRGLATGDIWMSQSFGRLFKEFKVALINSIVCSSILMLVTFFFWASGIKFSFVLSISLLIIMINATMIGAIVPFVLNKLKIDPAIATGPFVTTMNDIIGLVIYFTLITHIYLT